MMGQYYNMDHLWADVWNGNSIINETLLFVPDPKTGETLPCRLLCAPDTIFRVCSPDGNVDYVSDLDYVVRDGCIVRLPESRMPYFQMDEYYLKEPASISIDSVFCPGRYVRFEDAGREVHRRQVLISYHHSDKSPIARPTSVLDKLPQAKQRLQNRQGIHIRFYGDSFMEGRDSSGMSGLMPYLPPIDRLTAILLSDLWEHSNIRVSNYALGGTISRWGAEEAKKNLCTECPDLALIRFGMNDGGGGVSPSEFKENMRKMIQIGREVNPNMEFLLISTEVPNPDCKGWTGLQRAYEPVLRELAEEMPGCGFFSMGNLFDVAMQRKGYASITANMVNHPNDFMIRLYASAFAYALYDGDDRKELLQ